MYVHQASIRRIQVRKRARMLSRFRSRDREAAARERRYIVHAHLCARKREITCMCVCVSACVRGRCTRAWAPLPPEPHSTSSYLSISTSFFYLPAQPTHMCMCTLVFSVRSEPAENARYCYIIIIVIVRGRSFAPVSRRPVCREHFASALQSGTVRETETKIIPI